MPFQYHFSLQSEYFRTPNTPKKIANLKICQFLSKLLLLLFHSLSQ
jgi:hypothetical protein